MSEPIVYPKIFMVHIWMIFNKNTQACERSAIEKDKMENIQDIFIHTL